VARETGATGGRQETPNIVEALEWDIIFGRIHPRERLVEDHLVERFGSTRHKVRQALAELMRRGLVVQIRNRGAQVRDYSVDEVRGLYDIRNALQSQAIRRMQFPFEPERLAALRDMHEEHCAAARAGAGRDMLHLNDRFHALFFEACTLPVLADAIAEYALRTHPIRSRGFFNEEYRTAAQEDHASIIALAGQSGDDVREELIALNQLHINRPRDLYLAAAAFDAPAAVAAGN
jgi:DNA-binding GntR family transcriptional regulator